MGYSRLEPECKQVVENLKRIRIDKQIPVADLALDAGLSNSNMFYILSGKCLPSLNSLVKIAKALNVNLQDIIGDVSKEWKIKSASWKFDRLDKEQKEIVSNLIDYFAGSKGGKK